MTKAERVASLRLAGALGWFWAMFGYHAEGERWLQEALARAPQGLFLRTRALIPLGMILASRGEIWTGAGRCSRRRCPWPRDGTQAAAAMARIPLGHVVHYGR